MRERFPGEAEELLKCRIRTLMFVILSPFYCRVLTPTNPTTQHLASHRRPRRGLAPRRLGRSHRPALVSSGDGTHTTKVSGADILHAVSEGDPVVLSELAAERRASDHEEL